MSASRFALNGIGTAIFRAHRTAPVTVKSSFIFSKPVPFRAPSSAAAETLPSVDQRLNAKGYLSKPYTSAAGKTLSYVYHPWSEWVSFVDCLIAKGYLSDKNTVNVYTDKNSLEDGCFRFGRDLPDLLMSLPRREMKAVVKERWFSDCIPADALLPAEVLNSAKRLRAYLQLDDREVWEYCERRFLYPEGHVDFENEAGPVDIVRILLYYALDSLVPFKRPGREVIESSARELLYKLELHEYIQDTVVFDLDRLEKYYGSDA